MAKVLITGAGGFIGSHLVELCLKRNYKVRAFVHYNSQNRWGWLDSLKFSDKSRVEIISGDIRDYDSVYKSVKGCKMVFHLAALIGIPYSYISPLAYIKTNIEGTYNVLQSSKENGLKNVIITSTSETYGTAQYIPIDEKHPIVGQSPYSATKISADQMALSYHRSFNLPVKIVRPFNTYGPRQSARAIIPMIIMQLLSGRKQIKAGSIHPTRDFIFIKDTVKAFIDIANSDKALGEVVNIAIGTEISIEDLARSLIALINPKARIVLDKPRVRPKNSEVKRLLGSNEKILNLTNWRPQYSLDKGLKETVKWFSNKKNSSLYKTDIYNV
jgi:dTDP-glucose 4,6-dehydratase